MTFFDRFKRRRLVWALPLVLIVALLLPAVTPPVGADSPVTLRVATTGQDVVGCGGEKSPCRTIQYAVNRAGTGSTILVAAGVYTYQAVEDVCTAHFIPGGTGVVCFLNKQLTLIGGYPDGNWLARDPAAYPTIIDGQNARRGVRLQRTGPYEPTAGLHIEGFTIRNGLAQGDTSGVSKAAFGGGLFADEAWLIGRDLAFINNRVVGGSTSEDIGGAGAGGGLAFNSDPYSAGPNGTLERVVFQGNHALGGTGAQRGGYALGGGLFTYGVTLDVTDVRFVGNSITGGSSNGSGVTGGDHADALGGAASFEISSVASVRRVTAVGNVATGGSAPHGTAGGAFGGAFAVEGGTFTLAEAEIRGNLAQGGNGRNEISNGAGIAQGGGLASVGWWSGSQYLNAEITLDRVTVIGNTARGGNGVVYGGPAGGGGAALVYNHGSHRIVNSIFADNLVDIGTGGAWVGGGGGGLWLQGVTASVVHTTFARNRVSEAMQLHGAQGLAVILAPPTPTTWVTSASLDYDIIADHVSILTAPNHPRGMAALQTVPNTSVSLTRGLFAGNTLDDNSVADAPGWRGTFTGLSSMLHAASARFVSPGAGQFNYHILGSSPARDQATGSTTLLDVDGDVRSARDIGADEWVPFPVMVAPAHTIIDTRWLPNAGLAPIVNRYEVTVTCPQGASPPDQGACGSPIGTGSQTRLLLTGLTNGKAYTVKVAARDGAGTLLSESEAAKASPWLPAYRTFLPLAGRGF